MIVKVNKTTGVNTEGAETIGSYDGKKYIIFPEYGVADSRILCMIPACCEVESLHHNFIIAVAHKVDVEEGEDVFLFFDDKYDEDAHNLLSESGYWVETR